MADNPARFRYVHYIATRVLKADELMRQQYIDRNVDEFGAPVAFALNAVYREGALMNVRAALNGSVITLQAVDADQPMLVFCRGIWEPFTTAPIEMGASKTLYLNYTVTSKPQGEDEADMAELTLSLNPTNLGGAVDAGAGELEKNAAAIPVLNIVQSGADWVLQILDNVRAQAQGSKSTGGLVKTTTTSSVAVADDDPRNSDQRVPKNASVDTTKVKPLGWAANVITGGIDSTVLVYSPGNQSVENAITEMANRFAAQIGDLSAHVGRSLGPGVHPVPTAAEVGAAPASHVGSDVGDTHALNATTDTDGFKVTRADANGSNDAFAFLLRTAAGVAVAGLTHGGDLKTPHATFPSLLGALDALAALGGPVEPGAAGVTQQYVDDHDGETLAAAKNYTDQKVSTTGLNVVAVAGGKYIVLQFSPNQSTPIQVAIGTGIAGHGSQIPVPEGFDRALGLVSVAAHDTPLQNGTIAASVNDVDGDWKVTAQDHRFNGSGKDLGWTTHDVSWTAIAWKVGA